MKSRRPSWASALMNPRLPGGKSASESAGASRPKSDGPRSSPPRISPTTRGCPSRVTSAPDIRATATMMTIWRVSTARSKAAVPPATRVESGTAPVAAGRCSPTLSAAATSAAGTPTSNTYTPTTLDGAATRASVLTRLHQDHGRQPEKHPHADTVGCGREENAGGRGRIEAEALERERNDHARDSADHARGGHGSHDDDRKHKGVVVVLT